MPDYEKKIKQTSPCFHQGSPIIKKNKRLTLLLVFGVIGMFGFCYLLVPLFTFVCRQTGINGKAASVFSAPDPGMAIDTSRNIRVELTTSIHGPLNFRFMALHRTINMHPGESKLIYFYAENRSEAGKTVQAVPSITPIDAARYLRKTECFCFTQQFFNKGERADMPVHFYIDPAIPKTIKEITLSYTLFDATGFEKKQIPFTQGRIDL